jgi:hypothetical protein
MKAIKKHLELPHRETVISTNTLQTKPFDNQKIEIMSNNNKQQLPIEWLQNELERIDKEEYYESIEYINARKKAFKEAKEMQKEQHIKTWEAGLMKVDFNEYYEQTYGGGEQ